ncbi:carboxypeptidase PM20D1 [Microbacteriaceae bacterium SG_E_30_P1]|uniref:Carboxypeptidase PM20D1 n=1 Tax=Antiquaquibacter oligotrophicus TaxID=2880260 RepID=A0ABT6KNC0_9MICO|nr:M20/M25/M40 family metallo-hydrolase [Antiquaquibacter oligotrophicus]MDH6180617.1 carboxypeptidase PM20D1 [Antiquaquibacter oligotrophicus]UDF13650.1 M20/M25/M40 family metallo-hydrolase [Antiquaquibacter oligotrophicus]
MSSAAVERFRALLRVPTVSRLDVATTDWPQFERFRGLLEELYPRIHEHLDRDIVAGHSLLFRWKGASSERPLVLLAHYDVVDPGTAEWQHPPFDAALTDDGLTVWARGALDDKGSLAGILEAVESLLESGHHPEQDVYLAFGHDEETRGSGALAIADLLAERGVHPALVLDEGGAVALDGFPGVDKPLAVVGVSEKGTTVVRLVVNQPGGHASTPPRVSATARLARAIDRITRHPFPVRLSPPVLAMLRAIAPHASGVTRVALSALPLSTPIVERVLAGSDETRAMIQTSCAVTTLTAGHAVNALPESAEATVNLRIAVGSSVDAALRHLTTVIADPGVHIEIVNRGEPAPVSPTDGPGWDAIATTVGEHFPDAVLTPYVQTGATDSRHFTRLSAAVYRFTPFRVSRAERDALHARDERLSVASFEEGIRFYRDLIARFR